MTLLTVSCILSIHRASKSHSPMAATRTRGPARRRWVFKLWRTAARCVKNQSHHQRSTNAIRSLERAENQQMAQALTPRVPSLATRLLPRLLLHTHALRTITSRTRANSVSMAPARSHAKNHAKLHHPQSTPATRTRTLANPARSIAKNHAKPIMIALTLWTITASRQKDSVPPDSTFLVPPALSALKRFTSTTPTKRLVSALNRPMLAIVRLYNASHTVGTRLKPNVSTAVLHRRLPHLPPPRRLLHWTAGTRRTLCVRAKQVRV